MISHNNFPSKKISAYSADNNAVNYKRHNSTNIAFTKLLKEVKHSVKANWTCHIINNCLKKGNNSFKYDIERTVLKIFSKFRSSVIRDDQLKKFCEFVNIEHKEILRHVTTRWPSRLPGIERITYNWPVFKAYFQSKGREYCSDIIWKFFIKVFLSQKKLLCRNATYVFSTMSYLYFITLFVNWRVIHCLSLDVDEKMRKLLNHL